MNNEKKNIFFDLYNMLKFCYKKRAHSIPFSKILIFVQLRQFRICVTFILFLKLKQLYSKLLEHVLVSKLSDERY